MIEAGVRLDEQKLTTVFGLERADAQALALELGPRGLVRPSLSLDAYEVNPGPLVGMLTLPSGRSVEISPKVPIGNVFYLLARVGDLPFRVDPASYARAEDILEFLAGYLCDLVDRIVQRGLYREYVESEGNLSAVRGRISFAENVRQNIVHRERTYCRFTELSWDILENQVLRQVLHMLTGWGMRGDVARRLRYLDGLLEDIPALTHGVGIFDRIIYHRLNDHYRTSHAVARLLMEAASISHRSAGTTFRTFLINMNSLFERFVRNVVAERVKSGLIVVKHDIPLDVRGSFQVQPDLLFETVGGEVVGVADAKYERLGTGIGGVVVDDLYQMLSYCIATGSRRGFLVYPKHVSDIVADIAIRGAPVTVCIRTVDLDGRMDSVEATIGALAEEIEGLAVRGAAA